MRLPRFILEFRSQTFLGLCRYFRMTSTTQESKKSSFDAASIYISCLFCWFIFMGIHAVLTCTGKYTKIFLHNNHFVHCILKKSRTKPFSESSFFNDSPPLPNPNPQVEKQSVQTEYMTLREFQVGLLSLNISSSLPFLSCPLYFGKINKCFPML